MRMACMHNAMCLHELWGSLQLSSTVDVQAHCWRQITVTMQLAAAATARVVALAMLYACICMCSTPAATVATGVPSGRHLMQRSAVAPKSIEAALEQRSASEFYPADIPSGARSSCSPEAMPSPNNDACLCARTSAVIA